GRGRRGRRPSPAGDRSARAPRWAARTKRSAPGRAGARPSAATRRATGRGRRNARACRCAAPRRTRPCRARPRANDPRAARCEPEGLDPGWRRAVAARRRGMGDARGAAGGPGRGGTRRDGVRPCSGLHFLSDGPGQKISSPGHRARQEGRPARSRPGFETKKIPSYAFVPVTILYPSLTTLVSVSCWMVSDSTLQFPTSTGTMKWTTQESGSDESLLVVFDLTRTLTSLPPGRLGSLEGGPPGETLTVASSSVLFWMTTSMRIPPEWKPRQDSRRGELISESSLLSHDFEVLRSKLLGSSGDHQLVAAGGETLRRDLQDEGRAPNVPTPLQPFRRETSLLPDGRVPLTHGGVERFVLLQSF